MNVLATVQLPHAGWQPRAHQKKLWRYLMNGGKRAVAIWHRRAGKDEICLNATAMAMFERPGNYWHCLPEFTMGRKAIWDSVNPHSGRRRIDEAFPHEMRSSTRDQDMRIEFHNGSTWNVVGSDSVVHGGGIGSSVAGVVFSEWALANPSAWGLYRPILEENNGWAAWISTPRGRNHLLSLYQHAQRTDGWFSELLAATDTTAVSAEALAETLNELVALYGEDQGRAMYEQEMLCSFNAAILGAFYAREMSLVRSEERVRNDVDALPGVPVHRAWDLGVRDDTSIFWFQPQPSGQILILDHLATSGVGVEWWRDEIFRRHDKHGWTHGTDYVPHDAKVREFGTGRTRVETMMSMGLKPMVVRDHSINDGINAARRMLPLCIFHTRTDESGVSALEQYRREWDDDKKAFRASAVHDWTSHVADSFRYLAMGYQPSPMRIVKPQPMDGWRIPPPAAPRRGGIVF